MTRLIVEPEMSSRLVATSERVELCDRSGKTLGYFTPKFNPDDWEGLECPLSEEELHERLKDTTGRPLADILADLEARG